MARHFLLTLQTLQFARAALMAESNATALFGRAPKIVISASLLRFASQQPPFAGTCEKRCRMHGGAPGSGAPRADQNARKHGLFTRDAIAERRQIQALLGEARKLMEEMK
jgi:hypothetical protein